MSQEYPLPGALIPHRAPALLLRKVLSHDSSGTVCEGSIDPVFDQGGDGEVSSAFGLELIAQAAAVHHGLRQQKMGHGHRPASRGLLLGSRRLHLAARTIPVNAAFKVAVTSEGGASGVGGMIRFEGVVSNESGQVMASGDVTVLEVGADETSS